MADFSTITKHAASEFNGGIKYTTNDQFSLEALNASIENGLYASNAAKGIFHIPSEYSPFERCSYLVSGNIYDGDGPYRITNTNIIHATDDIYISIDSGRRVGINIYNANGDFLYDDGWHKNSCFIPKGTYFRMLISSVPSSDEEDTTSVADIDTFLGYAKFNYVVDAVENLRYSVYDLNDTSIVGYSGTKLSLVDNSFVARKLVDYTDTKWGIDSWAGGLAVYKNIALIGYNMGYLAVFDIYKNEPIATGRCSTSFGSNHLNNLSFDYGNIKNNLPVVYTTRAVDGNSECYVEKLNIIGNFLQTELIQTITYEGQYLDNEHHTNWCLNRETNELVAIIYNTPCKILVFDKPATGNATVKLTDTNVKKVFSTNEINVLQGSDVNGNRLFVTDGYSNGYLKVFSLTDGSLINSISLSGINTAEPEGLCIYANKIYINFHITNDIECILYECIL